MLLVYWHMVVMEESMDQSPVEKISIISVEELS